MKRFFCLLCVLALSVSSQAQRNYNEAILQGDVAFRQLEYKLAVDKYFAAEAFDPTKKEVVKAKVKLVFDEIQKLREKEEVAREQAQEAQAKTQATLIQAEDEKQKALQARNEAETMRDSILKNNTRIRAAELLIEINDIQYLGEVEFRRGDYIAALHFYQSAVLKIGDTENADSALVNKNTILQNRINLTNKIYQQQQIFRINIKEGDSLSTLKQVREYVGAYDAYFRILEGGAPEHQAIAKEKLSNMEEGLSDLLRHKKGKNYYSLLDASAQANLYLGNTPMAMKRIKSVIRYPPISLDSVLCPPVLTLAKPYHNSIWRRLSIASGLEVRSQTPAISINGQVINFVKYAPFLAISFKINKKISIETGYDIGTFGYFQSYSDRKARFSFSGAFKMFAPRSKKWWSDGWSVIGLIGLKTGTNDEGFEYENLIIDPQQLEVGNYSFDYNLNLDLLNTGVQISSRSGTERLSLTRLTYKQYFRLNYNKAYNYSPKYLNVITGIRFCMPMIRKYGINIFSEFHLGLPILPKQRQKTFDEFNLGQEILNEISPLYDQYKPYQQEIEDYYLNTANITVRVGGPNPLKYELCGRIGLSHQF